MNRLRLVILLAVALAAGAVFAACGEEEEELHVVEGEPVELGDLSYNVQITRFLNPNDAEDQGYLVGQERPEPGQAYLGVFLTIENDGDEAVGVPSEFVVTDTAGDEYHPIPSGSPYALQLPGEPEAGAFVEEGAVENLQPLEVPPEEEIPIPNTTAATGPIGGAMLLFLVDEVVTENRPLELEIPGPDGEAGVVELDI